MRLLVWFAVFMVFVSGQAQQHEILYGDQSYLPIVGLVNKVPAGILVDRMEAVGKKAGIQFQFELFPWARALSLAQSGSGGIIGISKTVEREKIFDFSEPIYIDSIILVVKKGREFKFQSLEDLNGKKIGAQIDASYGEEVDQYLKSGKAHVDRDVDRVNRIVKLLNDRIDVALIGNGHEGLKRISEDNRVRDRASKLVVLPKKIQEDPLYVAFAKTAKKLELLREINKALKALPQEGQLKTRK
jgi:ABC-type amino acid transport substrate-binding protein